MIYTDNCCCCIELKCGCIIIAIVDVIMRGVDRFFLDRESMLGYAALIISGIYLMCSIVLLIGSLLGLRLLLLPYIFVAIAHVLITVWECAYVVMVDELYDFVLFDIFEAALSLYFCLVVYSYYDMLSST